MSASLSICIVLSYCSDSEAKPGEIAKANMLEGSKNQNSCSIFFCSMYSHRFIAYDSGQLGGVWTKGLAFQIQQMPHKISFRCCCWTRLLSARLYSNRVLVYSCILLHSAYSIVGPRHIHRHMRIYVCICICTLCTVVVIFIHSCSSPPASLRPALQKVGLTFSWCLSESSSICYA